MTTGRLSLRGVKVHESFANAPYVQPNMYNETFANIGTGMLSMHNRVALMRGPVVYCVELPKESGGEEMFEKGVFIPENIKLTAE